MRRSFAIVALLCSLPPVTVFAGDGEAIHTLFVQGGGGFTYNVSDFDNVPDGLSSSGLFGTVRVMWKPEHLLSFGIESGFQRVYSVEVSNVPTQFGTISGTSVLNALPVLLIFSMPVIEHVEVYLGAGFGVLYSTVEFLGDKTVSNAYTPAFMAAGSYLHPISENFSLGGELRYVYFDRFVDQNVGLQVLLSYRLTSW
jgi:hypothetical protein